MNIRDLEAFVAVVETGSIIAASARLNLTQPGVTRRVQNLEEHLGSALLDRQSKPLKPTPTGREAYEQGRRVLSSLADLEASVAPERDFSGEFRLGVISYLSEAALSEPLDRLYGAFPQMTLRITSGWSQPLLDKVLRSELDAAALCLADGISPPDELHSEELDIQRLMVVAAPSLGVPKRPTLADLSKFSWVLNENGCGFRSLLRHSFESERLPFQIAVEAISVDLRMSLVARGMGLGIVTPASLSGSRWRDAVEEVKVPHFRLQGRIWLVHRPPAGRLARPLATFRDALAKSLKSSAPLRA